MRPRAAPGVDLLALTLTLNPDLIPGRAVSAGRAQVLGQGGLPGVDLLALTLTLNPDP